ncbi:YggS family pyridoxal phosphate-dependent enzyme [Asticcacaulis machinosus]|uniref:Pyridoxal phosphate homeostasis protein n=1 Tax=Asticcacaulis machinosus TaxID=2984211 RepID=A0ABT5HKM4_9CAUL|nr:YggS family pyridoxal phosphate-dependent enzyme [Asticcacaulis machinosus]MDC7676799.1 YggS family pyridoxal phosphate-dependent enzyme [Asticcacaulis machinosus]
MVISTQPAASAVAYGRIVAQMSKALKLAARPSGAARLTAVSKNQPWEVIEPVLLAGHRTFGENRVQEAIERWEPVRDDVYADLDLRLIGPLQSNKAEEAVAFFDVIETVDREKIARAIADAVQKKGRCPRLFIQVNIGEEPQKAGILPSEADQFLHNCRSIFGLKIEGLMCIPPVDGPKGPYYALMQKIAARNGIGHLSYGMSDDFEVALRFGSNEIRVGTAIFGHR